MTPTPTVTQRDREEAERIHLKEREHLCPNHDKSTCSGCTEERLEMSQALAAERARVQEKVDKAIPFKNTFVFSSETIEFKNGWNAAREAIRKEFEKDNSPKQ